MVVLAMIPCVAVVVAFVAFVVASSRLEADRAAFRAEQKEFLRNQWENRK